MKKTFTLLIFIFTIKLLSAQIVIEPSTLELTLNESAIHVYNLVVSNKSNKDVNIWWILSKGSGFPSAWKTVMCDTELCYDQNADKADSRRPNLIKANSNITIKLDLIPGGVKGSTSMYVKLYDDKDFTNLVAQTKSTALVVADALLSTADAKNNEDLMIYPNPTDNFFFIKGDQNVARLAYYNLVSKEVRSDLHVKGQSHDISDLTKGVYFIRLMDSKNKLIRTIRLNKR